MWQSQYNEKFKELILQVSSQVKMSMEESCMHNIKFSGKQSDLDGMFLAQEK